MTWEQEQFTRAKSTACKKMGSGWDFIGPYLREALIKAEVLSILAAAADFENSPQGRLAGLAMRYDEETL